MVGPLILQNGYLVETWTRNTLLDQHFRCAYARNMEYHPQSFLMQCRLQPHPYRPTLLNMTLAISARDWLATAIGSAVFYGIGHQSGEQTQQQFSKSSMFPHVIAFCIAVGRLGMPGLSGHRLGMVLTIPTIAIGYTSSLKRSYLRHLGYLDNGNECMYPNYKRDDLTPYIVKHKVSDRHLD